MSNNESQDFSIALGGPLYQLLFKARLLRPPLDYLFQRIIFFISITWIPLLFLSFVDGNALGSNVVIPFLRDFDVSLRFLVSVPLMIYGEFYVHKKLKPIIEHLKTCGVVPPEEQSKFDEAVSSSMKLRNSILVEVALFLFVFVAGRFVFKASSLLDQSTWYLLSSVAGNQLSKAGWWYGFVSLPIFQFILLRWYFRFFVWAHFMWRVSRLKLHLIPTHPDLAGGIGFLEGTTLAFVPLLVAQGAQITGILANRIFHEGQSLLSYRIDIAAVAIFLGVVMFGPLLMFASRLIELRKKSLRKYGAFAFQYVDAFDRKWIANKGGKKEELLGTADLQSLADLGNSYLFIKSMRAVPFSKKTIIKIGLSVLAPISPLVLTLIPIDQLIDRVFHLLF